MSDLAHRKATARVRLLNPDGTPAANRSVRVDQSSHKFLFGCGAFENPPEVVAKAFKQALDEFPKVFERVEFAVYCVPGRSENYEVFKRVMDS